MDMVKHALLPIALVAAAFVLGQQVASIRTADQYVTVKGLAELPAVADVGTWSLSVKATGNELKPVMADMQRQVTAMTDFLVKAGVPVADIQPQPLRVEDAQANTYNNGQYASRFVVEAPVQVRTTVVEALVKAAMQTQDLVAQGVVLNGYAMPIFSFTKLNEMKPQLIAEATKNARMAAQKFADDSGSAVGGIRRATQGQIEILGRDRALPDDQQVQKTIRVVTTVDYRLD
ncbi:MAG: SIMPL domain-containing protein [Alphaproteobacteria bacterium]